MTYLNAWHNINIYIIIFEYLECMITLVFPVIIVGYNKSSSSALYNLFALYPGAVTTHTKENCPSYHESLVHYFQSLPAFIKPGNFLIDGCQEMGDHIKMIELLKTPMTLYVVCY